MQKVMLVTVEVTVEENVGSSDIKENVNNLSYVSEKPLKVVDVEFDRWVK